MKKFIGYYRDCDLLTMSGTFMAMLGCIMAIRGRVFLPIFCLIISGICDAFDGTLARRKNYKNEMVVYGSQLDSLSDMVSFGLFPLVLTVCHLPNNAYFAYIAIIFYAICGMIRLAYFNTLDICNMGEKGYFVGVPITFISILYPVVYVICALLKFKYFNIISSIFFVLVGLSFIYNIKIKKLDDKYKGIISVIGILFIIGMVLLRIFIKK